MSIRIYSELLNHIKTLSVQITLPTSSNSTTNATLLQDGAIIEVQHDGDRSSVMLPTVVDVSQAGHLRGLQYGSKVLSLRLHVGNDPLPVEQVNVIPWTTRDLNNVTQLACSACQRIIISRGVIRSWKDLPSEGWAEMMEFWHCHKPDEPNHDHQAHTKGYSAASQLNVTSRTGLVDATSMLISPHDADLQIDTDIRTLRCRACAAQVGEIEPQMSAYRLSKCRLASMTEAVSHSLSYPIEKWIACRFLTAMNSQGARKFNIICADVLTEAISIWLFAPFLMVSSTNSKMSKPTAVLKIMWKMTTSDAAMDEETKFLNGSTTDTIPFSKHDYGDLIQCLQAAMDPLPPSMASFQDWRVGLLPRFVLADIKS